MKLNNNFKRGDNKMRIREKIKQLIKKDEGYLSWENYKQLINSRDFLKFVSETTMQSVDNLLEKGE